MTPVLYTEFINISTESMAKEKCELSSFLSRVLVRPITHAFSIYVCQEMLRFASVCIKSIQSNFIFILHCSIRQHKRSRKLHSTFEDERAKRAPDSPHEYLLRYPPVT